MSMKNKIYFITIAAAYFLAVLFVLVAAANAAQGVTPPVAEEIAGPARHQTNITSVDWWVLDGEVVGVVASYVFKDVTTHRAADYWEFYDNNANLLAISWFDQFGIRRIAIDEGILQEKAILEGVYVIVVSGEMF